VAPRAYTLGRRAEAAARTRSRILAAAVDLYRERGVTQTTLKAVAERADVSRGTILHNFGGWDGLLAAVLDDALAGLDLPDERALEGLTRPDERARRFVEEVFRFYDRSTDWWQVFAGERNELPQHRAFADATRRYEAAIGHVLVAALGPLAADRVAVATIGTMVAPTTFYPLLGAGLSVDEAIDVVGELVADLVNRRLRADG
jgi:AcrR family transcriptional regulator